MYVIFRIVPQKVAWAHKHTESVLTNYFPAFMLLRSTEMLTIGFEPRSSSFLLSLQLNASCAPC